MNDKRIEDAGTYQMQWDCKFCGTTHLLALTHRFCPNCGAAQDPATRYFPADEDKVAVEDHTYSGADVICPACATANSASANNCQQCGSPLAGGERASTLEAQARAEDETFQSSGSRDVAMERMQADLDRADKKRGPNWLFVGVGLAAVVIVGFVLVSFFWTRTDTVEVVGHSWEREIEIETLRAVDASEWCDAMPGDAYRVTRREEQRSTRRVQDGEECSIVRVDQGDGTYTERRECEPVYREEPVFDDRCYFTVDRWQVTRSVEATGSSVADTPIWPEVDLARTGDCLGCEREGDRSDRYLLELQLPDPADPVTCRVDQDQWEQMPVGSRWEVQISVITGSVDCNNLQPAS